MNKKDNDINVTDPDSQGEGQSSRQLSSTQKIIALGREGLELVTRSFLNRVRPNLLNFIQEKQLLIWLLSFLIGIGVAYAGILFRLAIGGWQYIWLGTTSEKILASANTLPWWVLLLAPTVGGLLVGLYLTRCLSSQRVFGVADVIESRALRSCRIPLKDGLWSAFISSLSLGCGASAGREGPVVHLGATIASYLEDAFQLSSSARRTLLACGVAAAVSSSFNAPIAGVLFAHELILTHYAIRAFVPIVISSVFATIIARIHLGDYPAFIIPDYSISSYWEFPAFALLGLTCAAVAIIFQFSLIFTDKVARNIEIPLWIRPAIGGLMLGSMAMFFPQILGVGYDSTDAALSQKLSLSLLLTLLVLKTAATSITLASRFGGGVFSPSLYIGAMTGGAFGLIAASVFPEISSSNGLYAIIGMGAVAAAILGAPISTTVIAFELTNETDVTIALLLAVSISTALHQATHGMSFFHWQLNNRGIFLQDGEHRYFAKSLFIKDFMTPAEEGEIVDFEPAKHPWLTQNQSVEEALKAFDKHGCHRIAVIDERDRAKVIGWADHWAALEELNKRLVATHVEEHR
ncbi:MAG: chloride channel protein [Methyloligellaceae bacterium]